MLVSNPKGEGSIPFEQYPHDYVLNHLPPYEVMERYLKLGAEILRWSLSSGVYETCSYTVALRRGAPCWVRKEVSDTGDSYWSSCHLPEVPQMVYPGKVIKGLPTPYGYINVTPTSFQRSRNLRGTPSLALQHDGLLWIENETIQYASGGKILTFEEYSRLIASNGNADMLLRCI